MGLNREKLTESQFNRQKSDLHCRRPPWVFFHNQFLASHGNAQDIAPLVNPVVGLTVDGFVFPSTFCPATGKGFRRKFYPRNQADEKIPRSPCAAN
jgi:hypothetical protein